MLLDDSIDQRNPGGSVDRKVDERQSSTTATIRGASTSCHKSSTTAVTKERKRLRELRPS